MDKKKLYSYFYTDTYGESVVGIVVADTRTEARQILKDLYPDDPISKFTIRLVKFDGNEYCEIYYG